MKIAFGGEVQIAIKQFNESIDINNEKQNAGAQHPYA